MARYNIYAVAIGRDPNTHQEVYRIKFSSWKECAPYVQGVEGSRYKGFMTNQEAEAWMDSVLKDTSVHQVIKTSPPSAKQAAAESNEKYSDYAKSRFIDICKSCNVSPNEMVNRLIQDFVNNWNFMHNKEEAAEEDLCPFDE